MRTIFLTWNKNSYYQRMILFFKSRKSEMEVAKAKLPTLKLFYANGLQWTEWKEDVSLGGENNAWCRSSLNKTSWKKIYQSSYLLMNLLCHKLVFPYTDNHRKDDTCYSIYLLFYCVCYNIIFYLFCYVKVNFFLCKITLIESKRIRSCTHSIAIYLI